MQASLVMETSAGVAWSAAAASAAGELPLPSFSPDDVARLGPPLFFGTAPNVDLECLEVLAMKF